MLEPLRPDPDALLALAKQQERRASPGRLKVFLGAAPGVGKTYAMLEAAIAQREAGVDVVAGIVETHGRKETQALLDRIEQLPRRSIEYRGQRLAEFDLDAALARKPALILVDELAHTNAEGCRHAKRWQDVTELLDRGIDVYTTLNVQHLESLNDIVARVTGVLVRETVPDAVLENAEAVELVDLPPEELLVRMREGKVYLPEQAGRALEHFFREANLTALRELALRATAEQVNARVQTFREGQAVQAPWPTAERVLVCIGPFGAGNVIRAARRVAAHLKAEWTVAYVETPAHARLPAEARARVNASLHLAEQLGAEPLTLSGASVAEELLSYARARNVTRIVVGKPSHRGWRARLHHSLVDELLRRSGGIEVHAIATDDEPALSLQPSPASAASPLGPVPWPGSPRRVCCARRCSRTSSSRT